MAFLKIFSGKSPEEYEHKGDVLFKDRSFGDAKLEYEAGLYKLEKKSPENMILKGRFQEKILQSKEYKYVQKNPVSNRLFRHIKNRH